MDLRVFASTPEKDISAYAPPESTELYGKQLTVSFEGGESLTLEFSNSRPLRCVKIKDAVWLITAPEAAYVLDMGDGTITRAVPGADGFAFSFGSTSSAPATHKLSDDFDGNTMEWTFGNNAASAITECVTGDEAVITRPLAPEAPAITTTNFKAVKITDTVYLQTAVIECGGKAMPVCLVCDFVSLLCAGALFGQDGVTNIGGYGRIVPGV